MKRKVFAVQGKSNVGKSTTVRKVFEILSKQADEDTIEYERIGWKIDFRAVLVVSGRKIGLISRGDEALHLEDELANLIAKGCVVIVCATHTRGGTVDVVQALEPRFSVEFILKPQHETNEQDRENQKMAKEIVARVIAAINT